MMYAMKGDLTGLDFDLIVCPANPQLLPGSGVNKEIFETAGRGLLCEVMQYKELKAGQAIMTDAYHLPCKKVIHAVGPVYNSGQDNEEELLASCYWNALALAYDYLMKSEEEKITVAFPCISTGVGGFPDELACHIAVKTIRKLFRLYPEAKAIDVAFVTRAQEQYKILKEELAR